MLFKAIEVYRSQRLLRDILGDDIGVVAVTSINGKEIAGVNSKSPDYSKATDGKAAERMRDILVKQYPKEMKPRDKFGQIPNNALFHAETTVLLRAARELGGTLEGRTLVVAVDKMICESCPIVLPKVALELGNPTVIFVDRAGHILGTAKDGTWRLPE